MSRHRHTLLRGPSWSSPWRAPKAAVVPCRASRAALALGLLSLATLACNRDQRVLVPNRVLDRPLDAVVACVRDSGTQIEVLSLNQCAKSNPGRCSTVDSPTPQLIGFVANSERNEVGMFRRCDRQSALVDMDPEAPGYNLLPAGTLPSSLTITSDSCRVISANAGSCDLTMFDVTGLGSYAVDTPLTGSDDGPAPEPPDLPPPSSFVSTLVPRRSDGRPLAASPGEIVAVPSALSLAGSATDPGDDAGDVTSDDGGGEVDSGGSEGFEPGDPDTGEGGEEEGGAEPIPEGTICNPDAPASVYVTFPSCQLVAEVSLATQSILQSRQFVTNEAGEIEVIDTGTDPDCPIDCPAQLDGELPDETVLVDPQGVFPSALALVAPPVFDLATPEEQETAKNQGPELTDETAYALYVGGPGSDSIYEIAIDDQGRFAPITETLTLEDPQGVQTIRATPAADVLDGLHQFLYVIVGDGSTRVIDRDFDEGSLGLECDTQIDPTLEAPTACHPVDPNQADNAIDRRPFAVGPGIRSPLGSTINDWAFHKLSVADANDICKGNDDDQTEQNEEDRARTPFCAAGLVGVGVTSLGTVVYASFGQFTASDTVSSEVDDLGIIQVQVRPHSLWPSIDPFADEPLPEALPLVADEEPGRALPGGGTDAQTLSPTLRRIDLAYAGGEGASADLQQISNALGGPEGIENVDQLGSFEGEGLYENPAPRVAVRDSQLWSAQTWTFEWEPTVPGTTSSTGLVECDRHGSVDEQGNELPGGTCRNTEPDDARLHDESANFCEDGVLAGDKLVILGCSDDEGCGLGQRCLLDPTGPVTASGICVSELAYAEEREALRDACAPFISDPCGSAEREFRITRATGTELWLQALERPERSVVRSFDASTGSGVELREYTARFTCDAPVGTGQACQEDADCLGDPYDPENQRGAVTCDKSALPLGDDDPGEGVCVGRQPDGGCEDDEACRSLGAQYLCIESVCRAPCELCPPATQPAEPCRGDSDCVDAGAGSVCIAGTCHEPCEGGGGNACLQSPLPGPRCFPELVRYTVRLHESFSFTGSSTPFLTDRVIADPTTGECVEDPSVSSLLTSRIRLGRDAESTFGTGPWQIADCVNPDEAGPDDPNPCRITVDRSTDATSLFHRFAYLGDPVPAIRYSNPLLSATIDLTSLLGLTSEPPDYPGQSWPDDVDGDGVGDFARFLRARIPSGYREEFGTINGFVPISEPVSIGATVMVYPVRIVRGPEANASFIVDAGGRGGTTGVRGQVVRVDHGSGQVLTDIQFLVR